MGIDKIKERKRGGRKNWQQSVWKLEGEGGCIGWGSQDLEVTGSGDETLE